MAVLPSDHLVLDDAAFREALAHGWAGARRGYLTTIALPPTRPETGHGYFARRSLMYPTYKGWLALEGARRERWARKTFVESPHRRPDE